MGSRLRIRLVLAAGGALGLTAGMLAGCGPAHGTVEVRGNGELIFTAAAGKTNDVTVRPSGDDLLVRDTGDTLTPGSGCTAVDANTARCTGALRVLMDLGDRNDVATNNTDLASNPTSVFGVTASTGIRGGPGNDVLNGGTSTDLLIGDEGADTLNGNGGSDVLREGRTAASTDVRDVDTFNGGLGTLDRASYTSATEGVRVDLDGVADDGRKADAEHPSEGDTVATDVENIEGGGGRDELTGDANANHLRGGAEDDELVGNLGNDRLNGQLGNDLLMEGVGPANVDPLDFDIFGGFDGGMDSGTDTVSYQGATLQVQVDIDDDSDDGRPTEGDYVRTDVEDLVGGGNDDALSGDGDANRLEGLGGSDTLSGNAGDDFLSGGPGFDLLSGGPDTDDCDVGGVGANGGSEFNCEA
jgi:Ca2+-binding RTX toxin-like protein